MCRTPIFTSHPHLYYSFVARLLDRLLLFFRFGFCVSVVLVLSGGAGVLEARLCFRDLGNKHEENITKPQMLEWIHGQPYMSFNIQWYS